MQQYFHTMSSIVGYIQIVYSKYEVEKQWKKLKIILKVHNEKNCFTNYIYIQTKTAI